MKYYFCSSILGKILARISDIFLSMDVFLPLFFHAKCPKSRKPVGYFGGGDVASWAIANVVAANVKRQ